MLSWVLSANVWTFIMASIVGLIALGAGLMLVLLVIRGCLACIGLTSWALSKLWAWLTGKPPSSWGTAHWSTESEIDAKGLFRPGSIPLGSYQGKPLFESLGGHVALIGPPRSRKSWGLLMPAITGWEGSMLVNDPRGELWTHTHTAREAMGPTYRFSPTQRDSCALNVLDAVRWGEDEAFGDVQRLVHGLLSPDPGEPWNDFRLEAEPLLIAVTLDRQAAGEGNLPAVLWWMTEPSRSMQQKAQALRQSPIPQVSAGGRRFLDKSARLQASVWSAALSALTIYQDPIVAANTDHSDVEVADLQHGTRPISVFLAPPFADVARLRSLLGTLTEMLVSRFSAQQDTPRQRTLLALDEFANLGRLNELERGMSYLQGCGVQALLVLQNVLQCRQGYGPYSPLLASVGTQVYYTPGDPETADYLSDQLGVSTARLHPESATWDWWGLLTHTTIGTSEHARPLLTSDECRRLDESAAVVLVKGLAPILGRKLGTPAPETVDLASPRLRKVAMLAGACILVASAGTWALWPTKTPALRLMPEAGGTPAPHQAGGMTADQTSQPPEDRLTLGWGDRMMIREPLRWGLYKETSGSAGVMADLRKEWIGGSFATAEACEAARQQRLAAIHQMIARQAPGQVHMERIEGGYVHRLGPKMWRQERWRCVHDEDGPS
jgi:type IV secretion system protein VirD4